VRRIALLVLNWNGKEDTARCLDSLRALHPPRDGEVRVLVVDNGSTDGSAEMLRTRYPWANVIETGANLRYAGGNNAGIRPLLEEGTEFILLLNNDTEADPDLVRELVDEADRAAHAGLFGPLILDANGRVWFAGGGVNLALGLTWHRGIGGVDPGTRGEARDTDYLSGCCLLVRREVFEKIGLLDDGYFLYAEDTDFCLRARAAGFACRYVPRARLVHRVSASTGGAINPFKAYQRTRAGIRLFARHANGLTQATWPIGFAGLLLAQSLNWIARGRAASAMAAWRAVVDVMLGRPADVFPVPVRSSS